MTVKKSHLTLLSDFEVIEAVRSIRDPMPKGAEPRHYRAVAHVLETTLLRKLNGGVVPSLYERCSEPGSLYRPIAHLLRKEVSFAVILNLRTAELSLWVTKEFNLPGAFRKLLSFEGINNPPANVEQMPCPHCGRLIHIGD